MMVKTKWIGLVLALLLAVAPMGVSAAKPVLTVLSAECLPDRVVVTYHLQDAVPSQEITCLITSMQGERLYVSQTSAGQGMNTLICPLLQSHQQVIVQLGGSQIGVYRSVKLNTRYDAPFLFLHPQQTVGGLKADLSSVQEVSVWQGETELTDRQPLSAGMVVKGVWQEQPKQWQLVLAGDVSFDGKITATDALWVLQYIVGKRPLDSSARYAADFRQNGEVSAQSALMILQYVVGKINTL